MSSENETRERERERASWLIQHRKTNERLAQWGRYAVIKSRMEARDEASCRLCWCSLGVFVEYSCVHKEKEECGQIHFSCVECSTTIPRLDLYAAVADHS